MHPQSSKEELLLRPAVAYFAYFEAEVAAVLKALRGEPRLPPPTRMDLCIDCNEVVFYSDLPVCLVTVEIKASYAYLDVMGSSETVSCDKYERTLVKYRQVIVHILPTHMLDKFYRPGSNEGL